MSACLIQANIIYSDRPDYDPRPDPMFRDALRVISPYKPPGQGYPELTAQCSPPSEFQQSATHADVAYFDERVPGEVPSGAVYIDVTMLIYDMNDTNITRVCLTPVSAGKVFEPMCFRPVLPL